ncbi:histidine phosphatase family protein [Salinibacterium sp. NK8237]|uniref:histidine phosphatase family protein n=1 Tax=Salinibacterium sp. NK8237 TaxID=2792038 RepID=UPI0018CF3FF2|nr:histidine phosphatase family protein [Salinibacterium sp. NK8237]MBH0128996.1 histidine phosphatase family protein [Salinibacterium sp. NK8237]
MFIYLVRHGETDWNLERRIQGSTDIPLNETGRAQARTTGELLARRQWDGIFASPLSRAMETAEIIASIVRLAAPEPVAAIVERNYGVAEGCTDDEIDALYPADVDVPGREPREAVAKRVVPALVHLAEQHHGESIIVVAHGGVIATVLASVAPGHPHGRIANGSVHSFRHDEGTLTLIDFDDPIEEESERYGGDDFEEQNALARRESGA